jgi:hypothetical protein
VIDLNDAPNLCTGMLGDTATPLCFRAIVALQRRHEPGAVLEASVHGSIIREELRWQPRLAGLDKGEDFNRVTEEGAEALGLALASRHRSWTLVRRLQSRMSEGADWLMRDGSNKLVALEISGTDEGDLTGLLTRKLKQARASLWARKGRAAACVVRFLEPKAILQDDVEPR